MKGKLWIPFLIVAVAAVGIAVGWQLRSAQAPVETAAASEAVQEAVPAVEPAAPAPLAAEVFSKPSPAPRPRRARRRATAPAPPAAPAAVPVAEPPAPAAPEPPAVVPVAAPAQPQQARSGVRRVEQSAIRVAEGTKIVFALNDNLSTKTSRVGDSFGGVVTRSVRVGEQVVIPEGSVVRGTVSRVKRAGRVKGRAELGLRFDEIELPDGRTYDLHASLTELDEAEKESVAGEGQVKGQGSKKGDVTTIGGGAGIGAVLGAITGGGKGAATGTAIGAGAGAAVVLLTRGKDVKLKRGSELAIQLNRSLTITSN